MSYVEHVSPALPACTVENCKKCSGEECEACAREPKRPGAKCLRHDAVERHRGIPTTPRTMTPTLPIERPIDLVKVEFADREGVAKVFERVAQLIRTHGSILIG